jgi:hypothetical protein
MADSNSLTLSDYAILSNSPLVQKISYSMLMHGNVLQDIPLRTYKSMTANGVRFLGSEGAPTVAFRALNADPATTKSVPTPYQEQAYINSNNFDIDNVILEDINSIQDQFAVQTEAYVKFLTYKWNDVFINNNHITGDANAPVGLRYRLDNPTDYKIPTEMKFAAGGSTVDISAGANGDALAENIQKMLDLMGAPDGTGVVLYMSELTRRKADRAIRKLGAGIGFDTVRDAFDRRVTTYQNAIVRTIGRKADQSTQIITDTESTAGADSSSTYSSIYGVKYGEMDFAGWQFKSLEEAFFGPFQLQNGVQKRITFDWPVGFWQENVRAVCRSYGYKTS